MPNRIIITGDFLRVNEHGTPSQDINIRWLYNLISPALGLLTNVPIAKVLFEQSTRGIATELYKSNGLEPSISSWVQLWGKRPGPRDLAIVDAHFADSILISFEIPELIRLCLVELAIPFVDFTIHPARFLDDLLFGVRTNITGLKEHFRSWLVTDEQIQISAALAMSSVGRLPPLREISGAKDVGVFAGQTSDDKVLIKNGKLLGPADFLDAFSDIAARHDRLIVKPHPYAASDKIGWMLTRLFSNAIRSDENFYHIVAHDQVTAVYSLTSSTSIEAAYFGKRGIHLAEYPYYFSDCVLEDHSFLSVEPALYLPQFWSGPLSAAGIKIRNVTPIQLPFQRDRLRNSLRNFWGADILTVR